MKKLLEINFRADPQRKFGNHIWPVRREDLVSTLRVPIGHEAYYTFVFKNVDFIRKTRSGSFLWECRPRFLLKSYDVSGNQKRDHAERKTEKLFFREFFFKQNYSDKQ